MNLSSKTLEGLSILGQVMGNDLSVEQRAALLAAILTGRHDDALMCAAYSHREKVVPLSMEQVNGHTMARLSIERLKNLILDGMTSAIEAEAKNYRKELLDELKASQRPHAAGTVSELATKLGVSKSEVRRMKTEGTLEEALSKLGG